ncbi:MAG: DNA polymerase III subunit gamma/tau, partial [Desulfuromusa sp.]|nr:DNA polymerase III subunit gamma/tau [Desulfuromusa sp.]
PRLTMEMVLVKLAGLPAGIDVSTLIKRLETLEKQLASGLPVPNRNPPKQPPVPQTIAAPPPEEPVESRSEALTTVEIGDKSWAGLVEFVKNRHKPRISSLLEQSSLLLLELPCLRVGMPGRYFSLADSDMRQAIQDLATEYFSTNVKIEVEKIGNGDKAPPSLHAERTQQESDRQKKLRENAVEHPLVKSALDIFGGKIEDVKPIDKGFV